MELNDSTETTTTRSPLSIDLNEIPSSTSPPVVPPGSARPDPFDSGEPDAFDIVRSFHDNPDPSPGVAAGLPGEDTGLSACGSCGAPEVAAGRVMVCDGCERGFHLECAGFSGREVAGSEEWICGECKNGGVESKRWRLGVKSGKRVLDINASPPSDGDGDVTEQLLDLRKHIPGHFSFCGNEFGTPITFSNILCMGDGFDFKKGSELLMHALGIGYEDAMDHTKDRSLGDVDLGVPLGRLRRSNKTAIRLSSQNPSDILLQGLREFISERHGELEEGWHVELKHSTSNNEIYAVYCSPDGKTFGSVSEVAHHFGLTYNCTSVNTELRKDGCPSEEMLHLQRKRNSKKFSLVNGSSEIKGTLVNGFHKEHFPNDQSNHNANFGKITEVEKEEDCVDNSEPSDEGFPVQFEDFFILSLGTIDVRPSYHDVCIIWPKGYRSCWHDKVTGSIFMCEVSEGDDSGPFFKVRRFSCSKFPVPNGSTVLFRRNHGQFVDKNTREIDDMEMILADPSPPTEFDILNCLANNADDTCNVQTSDSLQTSFLRGGSGHHLSTNLQLGDQIGEITVEERSSPSAWRTMSQKLIDACSELYKRGGYLKFSCNHVDNLIESSILDTKGVNCKVSLGSLARFCSSANLANIPIEYQGELDALTVALSKWLDQDRFGLDTEFVQEMIEQLPGAKSCSKYEFLINRDHYSASLTLGSGLLLAKRKNGDELGDTFRRFKKPRLVEDDATDNHFPPPGKLLFPRLPPVLVGEVCQVWELLWRFHEILGMKEPFPLEKLEEELVNPRSNHLSHFESFETNVHGSQGEDINSVHKLSGKSSSTSKESHIPCAGNKSHVLRQVETVAVKDAGQTTLASIGDPRCSGLALTMVHISLLGVLIGELQSKAAAVVDPNFDTGESKSKRGRRKDADNTMSMRKNKLNMLPINELTWPELARRYVLAIISLDCNLESTEITARESGKVFRCLQGDGGVLCGSSTGIAGMEADALLLAEATKQIFGPLTREKDVIFLEEDMNDAAGVCEKNNVTDGNIPEWAQVLEPVRKLPTNVGTRIRKCVYEALEKCPPEWAKERLEHSISKEVYKGNASGPTKKAVLSVLADVLSERLPQKSEKRHKRKIAIPISEIIMKQCRIVLRRAATADDAKIFCTLLGTNLINSCNNDDEGLLGTPAMVSRPLDFRTIDLRLAVGAYGGSHESFLEDVRELWGNIQTAFGDQPDYVKLAEMLSQKFESSYEKEVVSLVQKFERYANLDHISAEVKKELDDIRASTNDIPKAPWDEGICKVCGVDKDDDSVLLCDTCDAEYHTYCLNPPLARIPDGNWYCPSCVVGEHIVQEASGNNQIYGRRRFNKYQGELTSVYLEALAHLAVGMEEKDYWEFSVDERIFLLKFLSDELLNSALLHQHLEQCAETMAELHQKLRSYLVEMKNLKSREEFLTSKAAKTVSSVVEEEVSGKVCLNSITSNQGKFIELPCNFNGRPSQSSTFSDNLPATEGCLEETGVNSYDKHTSLTNSEENRSCNNKIVNLMETEGQVQDVRAVFDDQNIPSEENNKSLINENLKALSNNLPQVILDTAETHSLDKLPGKKGQDNSIIPSPPDHQGFCDSSEVNVHEVQHVPPVAMNESQAYLVELSTVKNEIHHLQNSIISTESQLLKLSMRLEFLGSDSRGRLYWASAMGRHPQVIVDGSFALRHDGKLDPRDLWDSGSVLYDSGMNTSDLVGSKAWFPFTHNPNDVMIMSSPWVSYETDVEIEGLISWLKVNDPKERELRDSLLQWYKLRYQEARQTENQVQELQATLSTITYDDKTPLSNSLVTKAAVFLESKYGACLDLDTSDMLKNQGKNTRENGKEKMYRCDCLEPIWPSRFHCFSCHRTFSDYIEFEGHTNGRCNLVPSTSEKSGETINSSKAKKNVKSEIFQKEHTVDLQVVETAKSGCSEVGSRLIKFQDESILSPYVIKEICSKFVTDDSIKDLVQEIGLIGSNGIPSFVSSISPYLGDSTLSLIPSQKDSSVTLDWSEVDQRHVELSDNTSQKSMKKEINDRLKTKKPSGCLVQRERKTYLDKCLTELGNRHCFNVPQSSLRPLIGKVAPILRRLKFNLLDMEAAVSEESLRPSRAQMEKRLVWRAYVKSAKSIYEMVQATIILEEMIKTEYLRNERWYWSSLSAAVKTSTVASLALRIYALDAAIIYERTSFNSDPTNSLHPGSSPDPKPLPCLDSVDKCKVNRKTNRKRKEPES